MFAIFVVGAAALTSYTFYLDKIVQIRFAGKRWAVPARVYARPLELYEGAPISRAQLIYELKALGYRKVATPRVGGDWVERNGRFEIRTRGFQFWDGEEPSRYLAVVTADGEIKSVRDARTRQLFPIVRLDAMEIGSIYPAHKEDRVLVRRDDLPGHLVNALLTAEDRKFFSHWGVDPRGIARALWANVKAGRTVQGGSTITQQLVKNFFLTPDRTLWRKFNEVLMAILLDARYGKGEILEAYANEIYLGQDGARAIHGFGLASLYYFNRPVHELGLAESALLAGMVKGPSLYDPRRRPAKAKERRDLILRQMLERGQIGKEQAEAAIASGLGVASGGRRNDTRYPSFVDLVKRQIRQHYNERDLTSEGLRIFSTLDPWSQHQAEQVVSARVPALAKRRGMSRGQLQAAVVMTSTQGGEIRALIAGTEHRMQGFNRALDAIRPIGSLVKPAIYLTALTHTLDYNLITPLLDTPVSVPLGKGRVWRPKNYGGGVHGEVPLHTALAKSYNLAAVRLGMKLGLDNVLKTLKALGTRQDPPNYPASLLGAVSLSPLEVAQVYQTLAGGGVKTPLRAIREVLDATGSPLQRFPLRVERVVDPGATFLVNRVLVEVTQAGTGRGLRSILGEKTLVAGKTGTTNDLRDSWFAGFGRNQLAVVWVGRDDNEPAALTGASGALPIWGEIMRRVRVRSYDRKAPDTVRWQVIDPATGLLADGGCKDALSFPFIIGSEPVRRAPCAGKSVGGKVRDFVDRLFD